LLYHYIVQTSAGYIFLEYRYIYAVHHFQMQKLTTFHNMPSCVLIP